MIPARVLVTGASGFVGSILCDTLADAGCTVRAAVRSERRLPRSVSETIVVGEIGATTQWSTAVLGVDAVVHAAARAHVLGDSVANADLYMETNARGTLHLAQAAARAGVRRFVLVSSIKVNGEGTTDKPYTPADQPAPQDAYGRSKLAAEQALAEVASHTDMEAVSVRPPLVYGPGVRANFLRLLSWVDRGWPLPFGAIENRRSLISVWNLCDLLLRIVQSPTVPTRTCLVSDGEDVSTPELIRRIGAAMSRPTSLLPVPVALLRLGGMLTGRSMEIARLCGSLVVDPAQTRRDLAWLPPLTLNEGIQRTAAWYLQEMRRGR